MLHCTIDHECHCERKQTMSNAKITKHEHKVHHSAAEHHRKAAHHFEAAAKHQILAAEADDHDDEVVTAHHAYLAYGHQLQAVHFAELAAIEDESVDHDDVDYGSVDHSHHD